MAWIPPDPGALRARVRFERRVGAGNVGGVVRSDWTSIVDSRRARLLPLRGFEQVQADRLAGISAWELVVRSDTGTALVRAGDRVVDVNNPTAIYAIRSDLDLQRRGRWLVMTLEMGAEDGDPSPGT